MARELNEDIVNKIVLDLTNEEIVNPEFIEDKPEEFVRIAPPHWQFDLLSGHHRLKVMKRRS